MSDQVEIRSAQVADVDFAERTITLVAIPYGEETVVAGPDGAPLREVVMPGAFDGIETRSTHVTANREHDYTRTIGMVGNFVTDDPRGLICDIRVSRTALGDESLELANDRVLKASVGMLIRRHDQMIKNGLRSIRRAFLDHVSLVPNPAYQGAGVLAVRQGPAPTEGASELATPNLDEVIALLYGG